METSLTAAEVFGRAIREHLGVIEQLHAQQPLLEQVADQMATAISNGRKILWCGNGGSAADSQHLAAEFVGRFRRERKALASMSLTTDTSVLTSIGNDYGYDDIFRRQVEAHCEVGDIVVGISTSGNSSNVIAALHEAKKQGAYTVAFTGLGGGKMGVIADAAICVASKDTARVQEGHILCGHMLCDWVEIAYCQEMATKKEELEAGR